MIDVQGLHDRFKSLYGCEPLICRAPGRVNLIGEHTDYNGGFVMPAAIDFYTWAAVASREDSTLNLRSTEQDQAISVDLREPLQPRSDWSDYLVGVAQQLIASGIKLSGADVLIHGEVPVGAGLSSSAALEVSFGLSMLLLNSGAVDRVQLALLCQRAENRFVGTQSGIMDQFISCNGQPNHAIMLDCRSLEFSLEPVPDTVRLIVCNTMIRHELASGEYNQRRAECEEGVRLLRERIPGITALRDVSLPQLEQNRSRLPEIIYRRCHHVVTENDRVQAAAAALRAGRLADFGKLMGESHRSLRDDYEVSCSELDLMVELAADLPGVFGSRMTGGGFGGCTINLVSVENSDTFARDIAKRYQEKTSIRPEVYVCTPAAGASKVS